MMKRGDIIRRGAFVLLMVAAAVLYSCSSPNTRESTVSSASAMIMTCPTTVTSVAISNFAFQPNSVSIAVNDIVKWTNNDSTPHTVTSGAPGALDGKFDSGNLGQNASVCIQFLAAGTYPYFCAIHQFMTGTVTVQ